MRELKLIATLEREVPLLLKEDQGSSTDIPDQLWDGHGMLVAMILMIVLWAISSVAIVAIDYCTPRKPTPTSAMLIEQSFIEASTKPTK
jgi:hypothetical protein